ncbi:TPA: hypothetical protein I8235_000956 [Kluyvera intermedia]|nr:hypothetical protein [Kluyvera intermedia]
MTPREIELLTVARLEHEGHQLSPADHREIGRMIADGITRRERFKEMMTGNTFSWSKPKPRR